MALWRISFVLLVTVQLVPADQDCQPFWSRFGGNCYRLFGPAKSWQDAETHCQEFFSFFGQGHLASIHTVDENEYLKRLWKTTVPSSNMVWLGATDEEQEGHFVWSDGKAFDYNEWLPRQPDNRNSKGQQENCLGFWTSAGKLGWNDAFCGATFPYVCKVPRA